MYLVDTHTHLSHFPKDKLGKVIERAKKANVQKFINVACKLSECEKFIELANQNDSVWAAVGIHPTELTDNMERDLVVIKKLAQESDKVVAIGEIGLDYYHDKFPHDLQKKFLIGQLDIASELGLPAIIHSRAGKNPGENESVFIDLIQILKEEEFSNGVMHCYSGNMTEAESILDLGLMFSFTGIITYEQNEELREVVKMLPLDRIMLETDCPYLSIEGKRDQPGEPAMVAEIAKKVAEVKEVPLEEVTRMTTENAERFFGI